ncbi:hypothetical protein Q5692_37800 [Microcoleus sp. C2C3]|uniref:hypothetical protein n=1 Tax=unclassified Microcoleus TaxID=2642155 RepID=UPI002FCF9C71
MITVEMAIAMLQKFDPKAIVRIAQPNDNYSENVVFVEEMDGKEVHFCTDKPDWVPSCVCGYTYSDLGDCWIEVLHQEDNFGQIKTHRIEPPRLSHQTENRPT